MPSENTPSKYWWANINDFTADQLLDILSSKYKYGDIAMVSNKPLSPGVPSIGVVGTAITQIKDAWISDEIGDSFSGKSNFLNTLVSAWNRAALTRKWDRFPEGQPAQPGTYHFDGPHLLEQADKSTLLKLYDISGFHVQDLQECLARPIAIYEGSIKPGEWVLETSEAPLYVSMKDDSFSGVNLIVIVAPYKRGEASQPKIDRAMDLYLALRKKGTHMLLHTLKKALRCALLRGGHVLQGGEMRLHRPELRRRPTRLH